MTEPYLKKLDEIQPSQLYVSAAKLARVMAGWDLAGLAPVTPKAFDPVPVKALDGRTIFTDGHTRALAAHLHGLTEIRVFRDEDELDWEAYRICVDWCEAEGVATIADLKDRVIPADEYEVLWYDRCREMQQGLEEKRRENGLDASAVSIRIVNPQGKDALGLLHEAALEARALYPELFTPESPWPSNLPTPARGVYLVGYVHGKPLACGALRPLDAVTAEVRRIYVSREARRLGLARRMLAALESKALEFGYKVLRLETGNRQQAALALYEACGFQHIPPFGEYASDPISVCFEKIIG